MNCIAKRWALGNETQFETETVGPTSGVAKDSVDFNQGLPCRGIELEVGEDQLAAGRCELETIARCPRCLGHQGGMGRFPGGRNGRPWCWANLENGR
jgi:hypothetical protein